MNQRFGEMTSGVPPSIFVVLLTLIRLIHVVYRFCAVHTKRAVVDPEGRALKKDCNVGQCNSEALHLPWHSPSIAFT